MNKQTAFNFFQELKYMAEANPHAALTQLLDALEDQPLQILLNHFSLRETKDVLRYTHDGRLLHRLLKGMLPRRMALILLDELIITWQDRPPDQPNEYPAAMHYAIDALVSTAENLEAVEKIVIGTKPKQGSVVPETLTLVMLQVLRQELDCEAVRTAPWIYPTPHTTWLVCLMALFRKTRREGLLSIASMVEEPAGKESLFSEYPQTMEQPYLGFATDVLRLILSGNQKAEELNAYYATPYIEGLTKQEVRIIGKGIDASLLKVIWNSLFAFMKGYAAVGAAEFGRQAVPWQHKPSNTELYSLYQNILINSPK